MTFSLFHFYYFLKEMRTMQSARKHSTQRTHEPLQNMDQFALKAVQDMDNKPHACGGISETKPEQLSDAADIEEE